MKKTNPWEPKYVVMSSHALSDIAVTDAPFQNIADEHLNLISAEILMPLRFFESNIVDLYRQIGASAKEIQKVQTVLNNPYRLVVKPEVVLSDGTTVDWGIALFDVLENNYLEMGLNTVDRQLIVLDSYYRHNEHMAAEEQQMHEQNLVKLASRIAIATAHYLNEDCATLVTERVKWLKSPFATARERQLKQIYRNRYQEIIRMITVDLSKKSLQGEAPSETMMAQVVSGRIEVKDANTDEMIPPKALTVEESTITVEEAIVEPKMDDAKIEIEMNPQKKKTSAKKPRQAKAKKEEIVLEVLEDGTKIVQYERAGYWRTQRNKATGEEKKIWIEPKIMQRRVAAK